MSRTVVNATLIAKNGLSRDIELLKLFTGEIAVTLDDGKLYVGNGTGDGNNQTGFDGKTVINPDQSETAVRLENARLIGIAGDATGSVAFDGSRNVEIELVLQPSGAPAGTFTKVTVNEKGLVTSATTLSASDIPDLTLDKITNAGSVASRDIGQAEGNVPILGPDGKLNTSVIPASAITDTFVVDSEEEMLALGTHGAEKGDVAIRLDISKTFILAEEDPSDLTHWIYLKTPTDMVYSVNGHTGNSITITAYDVGLGNVTNESKTTLFHNAVLTGTPTLAESPDPDDDSTSIATTEFVRAQHYISTDDVLVFHGGTF